MIGRERTSFFIFIVDAVSANKLCNFKKRDKREEVEMRGRSGEQIKSKRKR